MDFEINSKSVRQTIEIGRGIGAKLKGGEVIGLIGPLGSGKTHLIKGIAEGLDAERAETAVSSPTFVIVNEYSARLSIYHIDAYRIDSVCEFEALGFDDYCRADSVVLLEWADKVEPALKGVDWVRIELSHLGPNERALHIKNAPGWLIG